MILLVLRACIVLPAFLLIAFLGICVCLVRPFNPDNARICGRLFSRLTLPMLGMRLEVEGRERLSSLPPCVVVANHLSNFDLFVFGDVIPKRTVSVGKKSLRYLPLFGQVYWLSGNIMINRGDRKGSIAAMDQIVTAMKARDSSIWVFAEGTRGQGDGLQELKKGAFHIALQAGVPIVPIIANNYPRSIDLKAWRSGVAKVAVLPPVSTEGLGIDDLPELMERVRLQMSETINRLDHEVAQQQGKLESK